MDAILMHGKGEPIRFSSARGIHYPSVREALAFADTQGWKKVGTVMSGVYYDRRPDGWWRTSDSEVCDRCHGLPPEGIKLKEIED